MIKKIAEEMMTMVMIDNFESDALLSGTGGKDSIYNSGHNVTINTGAGNDSVENYYGDSVTINTGAGDDYVDNYHGDSVTINTGDGNDSVENGSSDVTINTGAGNDEIFNNCYRQYDGSIYYYSSNNGSNVVFKYAAGDGYDTIWGFKADSTLSIGGGSYSTTTSGDDVIVTVGEGAITLVGAASLSKLNIKGTSGGGSSETNSWKLSGTTATYGTSSNTLITITGIKSLDGISLSGTTVTVSASALNKKTNVTLSGSGYKLKLGFDVAAPTTKMATWSYKSGTATYKSASTTAGYTLASNAKSISYTKAKAASTLATVKGVKSLKGISLSGTTVTVAASALNKTNVTLSGSGYKLALADNVSKSTTKKAAWSYKSGTATYKSASTTAGYSLASNAKSISYTKAKAASTLATVKGVKSADGLTVSGKVVTVAASALNKTNVTLSGSGYKLALAEDVSASSKAKTDWSYKSSVATLSQTKGEKYSLAGNGKSISYSAGTSKNLAKVGGLISASGLKVSNKVISVPNAIIDSNRKVSVNGSGYEFKFAAKKTLITGSKNADIITSGGSNSTINAGKGNDSINISGTNNVIVYKSGDGSDTITNYSEDDTIKITSGTANVTKSGSNVVFSVGNGSILLKGAADKTVSYISNGTATTFSANSSDSSEPYTISKDGKGVTLSSSYSEENFDVSEITGGNKIVTIDGSKVTHKLKIKGNSLANKIIGGKAGGILDGGKGTVSDTLIGGNGSDIFIYYEGDGNDVIKGYDAKDTITIEEGVVSTIKPSREDVVFQVGDGKLTIQDVKGTHISFVENGIEYGCLDGKRTLDISQTKNDTIATLSKNYRKDSFDVTKIGNEDVGNSITKIYASAVSRTLKITGNDKANQILGSSTKANTITGGGGDDTLQGGSGSDVFVYAAGDGNDLIIGCDKSDKISVTSGTVDNVTVNSDNAVVLTIGAGKIILDKAAGNTFTYYDANHADGFSSLAGVSPGNVVENWFVTDDDNFATCNDLSALVQSKPIDYSLAEVETSLKSANALDKLTYSSKK